MMSALTQQRVVTLIDMDCFYVQCEQRLAPYLWSHPCVVKQYTTNGGIIAVNYEARSYGVKRGMKDEEAIQKCPQLHVFNVPEVRGKAELSRYRDSSLQVFEAITDFCKCLKHVIIEKASIDEAFLDLTEEVDSRLAMFVMTPSIDSIKDTKLESNHKHIEQWLQILDNDKDLYLDDIRLAVAAVIVQQIRDEIYEKTSFRCSAGISHNKMLAKIVCGVNKPNAQTILPLEGIHQLFARIDINSIRNLGGKLGNEVKRIFAINTMSELSSVDMKELCKHFDRSTAKWLHDMSDGIDTEPVSNRQLSKSLGCGKNFPGFTALKTIAEVKYWIKQLCEELVERLLKDKSSNKRMAKLITVGYRIKDRDSTSKSIPIDTYMDANKLCDIVMKHAFATNNLQPIVNLTVAASKFVDQTDNPLIDSFFSKINKNDSYSTIKNDVSIPEPVPQDCDNGVKRKKLKYSLTDYFNKTDESNCINKSDGNQSINGNTVHTIEADVHTDNNSDSDSNTASTSAVTSNSNINESAVRDISDSQVFLSEYRDSETLQKAINEYSALNMKYLSARRGFFFRKTIELMKQSNIKVNNGLNIR